MQCNATTTRTMTTQGVDNHDKEDPSEGRKYARRANGRRRDQRLPRRYVAQPSRLMMAMQCPCSWRWQRLQSRMHRLHPCERGRQQSSRDCCCRDDVSDDNDDDELDWELAGTLQREQCCRTHRQRWQLLVWAFTTLTSSQSGGSLSGCIKLLPS